MELKAIKKFIENVPMTEVYDKIQKIYNTDFVEHDILYIVWNNINDHFVNDLVNFMIKYVEEN